MRTTMERFFHTTCGSDGSFRQRFVIPQLKRPVPVFGCVARHQIFLEIRYPVRLSPRTRAAALDILPRLSRRLARAMCVMLADDAVVVQGFLPHSAAADVQGFFNRMLDCLLFTCELLQLLAGVRMNPHKRRELDGLLQTLYVQFETEGEWKCPK